MSRFLRIKLLPTVIINIGVATVISGGDWDSVLLALMLLQGISLYLFGMGLNDRLDLNQDQINAQRGLAIPRPLVTGELSLGLANLLISSFFVSFLICSAGIYLWKKETSIDGLILSAITLGFILLYNGLFKFVPLLGPFCMGMVRGTLILSVATMSLGKFPQWDSLVGLYAFSMTLYILAVTHFSMEEERARPVALKLRKLLVFLAFSFPFALIYSDLYESINTYVSGLYLHGVLFISVFLWKQTPPLSPQRTTLLFLSGMTWIDFHFFWVFVSTKRLSASSLEDLPISELIVAISAIPMWMIAWFLWAMFGLGFKDRTLQSSLKNEDHERPAP
ncbi:MAG: hypothetical protein GWP41_05200 [Planctomycetia bacterium]|jgi:4-hydroxybenzoate polyprenyltransferase|nr:hypothetical protein [Planctomycetia bacterium]